MKISGFVIDYSSATAVAGGNMAQLIQGQRVRITGQVQAGHRLRANHIEIMRLSEMMGRMLGVMLEGGGHKKSMDMEQPASPKHNRMTHPADSMRRPMPGMGQFRPMPIIKP